MVRKLLTVALLLASCKSESKPASSAPAADPARPAAAAPAEYSPPSSDTVPHLQGELDELDKRMTAAVGEAGAAKTDAERDAASAKLEQLRAEQAALKVKRLNAVAPPRGRQAPTAPAAPTAFGATETKPTSP